MCNTDTNDNGSNNIPKTNGSGTPPPPYKEEDSLSPPEILDDNDLTTTTVVYEVPKDLSEGLSNPVFTADPIDSKCNIDKSAPENQDPEKGLDPINYRHSIISSISSTKGGEKEYKGIKRYLGLLLALAASFSFSVTVLFVKILKNYGVDAYAGSFLRYTGTLIPIIPVLFYYEWGPGVKKQESVFSSVWPVFQNENWKTWIGLFSRGLIGASAVVLRYYALDYLSIGDTTVITFSTPALVTILAHFFLGEKCAVFPILVAILTLCGVVIVAKPPIITGESEFDTDKMIGTGLACGSLLCAAIIVIISRKLRAVHFTVMTLAFSVIGVGQGMLLIHFLGSFNLPTGLFDSLMVAGLAVMSFFGQVFIVLATKFEQAGPISLVRSCDVVFGFLFQYLFLDVIPDSFSAVGAIIVLSGVLLTAFRKWLITLPLDDSRRRKLWFILK